MISGTITDASAAARCPARRRGVLELGAHAKPLTIGLNCALGAKEMRPYVEELARVADTYVSAYPNAGCPTRSASTTRRRRPRRILREFADQRAAQHRRRLLRHDAGAHPRDRRGRARRAAARPIPPRARCGCRGLEPLNIGPDTLS
jgi:5-methyltetrahydrofolate--homocysteine methyltransferase